MGQTLARESLANEIWQACDIMRRDDNCGGVMEYVEHLSWLLFLRFLDTQEDIFEEEARIAGRPYARVLNGKYRWSEWARRDDLTGDDLLRLVHGELIPHLRSLTGSPERDIIRSVFIDRNVVVMASGYNLKDVITIINHVDFTSEDDIHTVSFVYEDLLKRLGSENRVAGEFYTPRPIVRFMVEVADPKIGETVYDPACGSCGFLAESYLRMKASRNLTTQDYERLQHHTFFGQEKKPLPALLGTMNMVLHGVLTPTIRRKNTLEEDIHSVTEQFDVILTNPPFGGKEGKHIQQNFPVQGQATELLFLQHIMKKLKVNGRCGIVMPEGVLFRSDAFAMVKKDLLERFKVHTIVSLPPGVFLPYSGVKTSLLAFEKTGPTQEIWYYELTPPNGQRYTKGKPIADVHLEECRRMLRVRETSERSWVVPLEEVARGGYDLSAKNPNRIDAVQHRPPEELVASILEKEHRIIEILEEVRTGLNEKPTDGS